MLFQKQKTWLKQFLIPKLRPILVKLKNNKPPTQPINQTGTVYHDTLSKKSLNQLGSYDTLQSSLSLSDIEYNVNYNFYSAYGPDFKSKDCQAISVDTPDDYKRMLKALKKVPHLRSGTFAHYLPTKKLDDSEIACIIRHDVDGDLIAAEQQATIESELCFKTSYYILHTAPYYGTFNNDGIFARNETCITPIKNIQEHGHEIALHTDGMLVYQEHKRDGAECLKTEINWLRDNGIKLTGTTAHNSWPIYGVENFAIFKGKDRGKSEGKAAVTHNGKWAPIGVLDEKKLALNYEANELLWQSETPVFYAALRSQNIWRVDLYSYPKELSHKQHDFGRLIDFKNKFVSTDDLIDLINLIIPPCYLYLVIHPMHYGMRASPGEAPWLPKQPESKEQKSVSLVANAGENNEILSVAVNLKNEYNAYDRGLDCYLSAEQKIIFLGGKNLATNKVSADSKCSQVSAQYYGRLSKKIRTAAISAAKINASSNDHKKNYNEIIEKAKCDHCVVLLDALDQQVKSIVEWVSNLQKKGESIFIVIENSTKSNLIDFSLLKNTMLVEPIFEEYLGSANLYIDKKNSIWSAQGHHLVGQKIASAMHAIANPSNS